jgi:hypothetical protein
VIGRDEHGHDAVKFAHHLKVVMTGRVPVIHGMPLYLPRHREPRSGVAIQFQRLDCVVGGRLLATTKHKT